MRRFALLSSLLLPLPFAALPLLAVLAGGADGPSAGDSVLDDRAPIEAPANSPTGWDDTTRTQSLDGDPCEPDPALSL